MQCMNGYACVDMFVLYKLMCTCVFTLCIINVSLLEFLCTLCTCASVFIHRLVCAYVLVYIFVYTCVCVNLCLCACVFLCMYVHICLRIIM